MTIKTSYILILSFLFLSVQWKKSESIPTSLNGKWRLYTLHSNQIKEAANITITHLQIDPDGMTTGFVGCNKIRTNCTVDGHAIQFGTILSSRKFCEKEFMDLEDALKEILKSSTIYHQKNNLLTLFSGKKKLATFIKE